MREAPLREFLLPARDEVELVDDHTYVTAGILSYGRGLFERPPVRGAATSYKSYFRLRKGQFVYSKLFAWEGALAVVPPEFDGLFVSQEFPTFDIEPSAALPEYLHLLSRWPLLWERLRAGETGMGGRRKRVHPAHLLQTVVPAPDIDDQRRIVDLIRSADAVIAAATQSSSASAVAASRVRKKHFSETRTTSLAGECFEITMGRQRSPRHASGDNVVPYLRAANAKDGRLDLSDVKAMNFTPVEQVKYRLEDGDVLVTEGCGSLDQLGASAQWHAELPGVVCFQNTLLRIRGVEHRSLSDYAFQWARWCFEADRFAAVASGTNIFHVGAERAKAMMAPNVTLVEQREFLGAVEALDRVASHARALAAQATGLRLAVLADLLTDNHEIPDSYDALLEPAS